MLNNSTNGNLEERYKIDFTVDIFAEIVDFFINFYTDKIIDKFAKKKQVKDDSFMERVAWREK